jgi:hypothetical protein
MKIAFCIAVLTLTIGSCKGPVNITANPNDYTSTSGTLGSGKMTNELPKKSDNMKIPDTISKTKDTLRRN